MKVSVCVCLLLMAACICYGQPVTGVWRGRIIKGNGLLKQTYKLEVKLVKNGDSIIGTSYYYASSNNYFRYSVKGYFGTHDNSINWWDDQLIESKSPNLKLATANNQPLLSVADYNCPGSGIMLLDGHAQSAGGEVQFGLHLQKMEQPEFRDEWDPIIETYFVGGADAALIDSVGRIALYKATISSPPPTMINQPKETTVYQLSPKETKPATVSEPVKQPPAVKEKEPELVESPWKKADAQKPEPTVSKPVQPEPTVFVAEPKPSTPTAPEVKPVAESKPAPPTIEEKFSRRKNILTTIIPISGDTIEFKFYDNAEVDGDSISIFLNGKMLYTHIRLTDKGYSVKIPVTSLQANENDLVMVAENLGSIPPNTAYMEAWSGSNRYTARMESTEGSSAMIKLQKSAVNSQQSTGKP